MDSRIQTNNEVLKYPLKHTSLQKCLLSVEQRTSERIMMAIEPASGQILDCSNAALRFYGYSFETITSMRISEINTLPYFVVMKKRLEAAKKNRSSFIFPHKLADGRVKDVEVVSFTHIIDGRKYLISEIKDIAEKGLAIG